MRISAAALAAALLGCAGGDEVVNPLPTGTTTTLDAGAGGGGAGGGAVDAGPPKRTVMMRNPFGNVAETENLLWDGDFEWYSPFSDQYGWLSGASAGALDFAFADVKLGAVCRSGIRCAWLRKKYVIAGLAVASAGNKLEVSFWAHLAMGACAKVAGTLTDFASLEGFPVADPDVMIHPVAADPDAAGWCHYDAVVDARKDKPALFISNGTGGDVLVDDAVIKKVPPAMAVKAFHGPLTAELTADLAAARAAFRKLRGPHDAPPSAARRALQQWKQP
jgi:hypothetical protein